MGFAIRRLNSNLSFAFTDFMTLGTTLRSMSLSFLIYKIQYLDSLTVMFKCDQEYERTMCTAELLDTQKLCM